MAEQEQEKTLPATPQRLEKAREEGQVPRSSELAASLVLLSSAGLCWLGGPAWLDSARRIVAQGLHFEREAAFSQAALGERLTQLALDGLALAAPIMGLLMLAGVAGTLAIGGWMFTFNAVAPKAERLSPMAAFKRVFSMTGLGELGKTLAKTALFGLVAGWFVWKHREEVAGLAMTMLPGALSQTGGMVTALLGTLALVGVVIAAMDVPLAIWRYNSNLKMSLEEVKRESRESDGDPHVKGRIRQQQREMARRRMMTEVPKADVVVTNPTHYAVALAYREGEGRAPRVLAKGSDAVAARIRAVAAESGVPLLEAPPLARALHRHTEIGDEIPAALYGAVAQVLAWVYELRRVNVSGGRTPVAPRDIGQLVPPELDPAGGLQ